MVSILLVSILSIHEPFCDPHWWVTEELTGYKPSDRKRFSKASTFALVADFRRFRFVVTNYVCRNILR